MTVTIFRIILSLEVFWDPDLGEQPVGTSFIFETGVCDIT